MFANQQLNAEKEKCAQCDRECKQKFRDKCRALSLDLPWCAQDFVLDIRGVGIHVERVLGL